MQSNFAQTQYFFAFFFVFVRQAIVSKKKQRKFLAVKRTCKQCIELSPNWTLTKNAIKLFGCYDTAPTTATTTTYIREAHTRFLKAKTLVMSYAIAKGYYLWRTYNWAPEIMVPYVSWLRKIVFYPDHQLWVIRITFEI